MYLLVSSLMTNREPFNSVSPSHPAKCPGQSPKCSAHHLDSGSTAGSAGAGAGAAGEGEGGKYAAD